MTVSAFLEPLVVVSLLFGGAFFNRNKDFNIRNRGLGEWTRTKSDDLVLIKRVGIASYRRSSSETSGSSSPTLTSFEHPTLRRRKLRLFGCQKIVTSPNTVVFKDRFLSRVLQKYPFLVEAWYWALLYWVYQVGRALTAVNIVDGTVLAARRHALQLIHLEQRLHIFWEVPIQQWFLARHVTIHWINRIYSFIHIPGTIFFLAALYYLTTTRKKQVITGQASTDAVIASPALYEARRRTMAMCNLVAFVVFTLWPCMPPRLLSDPGYHGGDALEAKSYGFVDTVHSNRGDASVWTTNKFCNQYAAMPSLHFGYSLLIGLTIATLPVAGLRASSWKRVVIVAAGMSYPMLILAVIVATANHFFLDAVAGAVVCAVAWYANGALLNLCIVEDYFLWLCRIHKPVDYTDPETAGAAEYQTGLFFDEI